MTQKDFYQFCSRSSTTRTKSISTLRSPGRWGRIWQGLPEYRAKRAGTTGRSIAYRTLQPAWEARMKEARANPGKWTDWDHAYDAFQKYLDNADKILDTPAEKRTAKQADAITDHFVINYHRVITKELLEGTELFRSLRKQLQDLDASFPALSEAQTMAQDLSANRRTTHIHFVATIANKGIEVQPGVPAFLPALPAEFQSLAAHTGAMDRVARTIR